MFYTQFLFFFFIFDNHLLWNYNNKNYFTTIQKYTYISISWICIKYDDGMIRWIYIPSILSVPLDQVLLQILFHQKRLAHPLLRLGLGNHDDLLFQEVQATLEDHVAPQDQVVPVIQPRRLLHWYPIVKKRKKLYIKV